MTKSILIYYHEILSIVFGVNWKSIIFIQKDRILP
jgi:hypothetical protein